MMTSDSDEFRPLAAKILALVDRQSDEIRALEQRMREQENLLVAIQGVLLVHAAGMDTEVKERISRAIETLGYRPGSAGPTEAPATPRLLSGTSDASRSARFLDALSATLGPRRSRLAVLRDHVLRAVKLLLGMG